MSRRHQERPDGKVAKPHPHSAPAEVAAAQNFIKSETNKRGGDYDFEILQREHDLKQSSDKNRDSYCHCVAESNRRQRTYDTPSTAVLHPKSHGEEPAHSRIDAVIGAEEKERGPAPSVRHGSCVAIRVGGSVAAFQADLVASQIAEIH